MALPRRTGGSSSRGLKGAVCRAWFRLGLHAAPELVQQHLARCGLEVSLGQILRLHRELLRGTGARKAKKPASRKPLRQLRPKRPSRRG